VQIHNSHYMVWLEAEDHWNVYFHVRRGNGRQARRKLTGTYAVPKSASARSAPDLLRALASVMEEEVWAPTSAAPAAPASPGGPQGEPSTLT